jgi:fructose 1,6-bisphosphatase
MFKRLLSKSVVLGIISMVVVGAFVFNATSRGIVTPTANLRDSNYMLRPTAASNHIKNAVFGMGIETLNQLNAQGPKVLEKGLADLALSKTTDPLLKALIENNIAVVTKDNKTFIVCLIGNGWRIELTDKGELKKAAFASEKEKDEFMLGAQRTWVSMMGKRTPREIHEAQIAADAYIGQAGKEGRIFVEKGLEEQVKKYAKASGLNAETQAQLLKRLNAAIEFRNSAINSLTQADIDGFFSAEDKERASSFVATDVSAIKKDLSDDLAIRKAIIFDAKDGVAFSLLGDLSALEYLAVTASSGAGYVYDTDYKGNFPRSIYEILGMTESYMEMANAGDQDALKAYKAKVLLHEYVMVNSRSKILRKEINDVRKLISKYDRIAIANWIEREAKKVEAIEAKKTIAEATSADIGKFVKGGVIPAELIDTASAELQKLVDSGLLTDYRVVNKDGEVSILTTRQNSKAVEDDAQIPSAIQDVYLQVLIKAQEKGIYAGENLTDKSYRQQAEALELSASLPTLTYLKPEGWANIFAIRTELKVPEGQPETFFTTDYHSYKLSELLAEPVEMIPDEVVNTVREKLNQYVIDGKLSGALVNDFGGTDIDIQVNHKYGELNAAVQKIILEAMKAGVLKAQELGLLKQDIDIASMGLDALGKALRVQYGPTSINERGAEPRVEVKMVGAAIGAANIKLFHEFFMPGSTPLKKLGFVPEVGEKDKPGVRGFRAIVRRTEDVLKGNADGKVWEFEKSSECVVKGKHYASVDQSEELLALASQPNDYLITAIYTVEGSTVTSTEPIISVVYQPVYGEKGELRSLNPAFICRSQSGADAVGGIASMFYDVNFVPGGHNGENYVVTKPATLEEARKVPQEGTAHVVVYGWQSRGNGVIPRETGAILDHVAINPEALSPYKNLADLLAEIMITHPYDQPYLSPLAVEAQIVSLREAQSQDFTHAPKDADLDEMMSEVEARVASGEFISIVGDKADMGGEFGHNFTPAWMLAIDRATTIEAVEKGILTGGNLIGHTELGRLKNGITYSIGDDGHIIMIGDKTRNNAEAHQLSFLAFTRGYFAAVAGNGKVPYIDPMKPYGIAQDYQGKEAKAAKANPIFYSHFTARFFEILKTVMPEDFLPMVDNMENAWKAWQADASKQMTLPEPFSGNVSQQGIGTYGYRINYKAGERSFGILTGDKMGPAGINRVIREGVYSLLEASKQGATSVPDWIKGDNERAYLTGLIEEFKNGLVFEIWDAKAFDEHGNIPLVKLPVKFADVVDSIGELKSKDDQEYVKNAYSEGMLRSDLNEADQIKLAELLKKAGYVPTERIYLDALQDKEAIYKYLADSDRFNIKQVWSKKQADWDIANPQKYLGRPILGSSVTKLGILAGGEYVGKDDPGMMGNIILMEHIFAFLKDNPVLLQGDMNGSHWLAAIPTSAEFAVANTESHPIFVGFRYTLTEDGKDFAKAENVFGDDYKAIREKMFKFNFEFKKAQLGGQFAPYGTDVRTVEASYPLAKFLKALNAPNSPFLVKNQDPAKRASRPTGVIEVLADLFSTAVGSLTAPSAPEGWTGAIELAQKFVKSSLGLQSSGVSRKLNEEVFSAAKDITNQKVVLINASVLKSDPSLILAQQSINRQINQRSGVLGSTANIKANAFRFVLIPDEPGLKTAKDVENLFAAIAKETKNGAVANKDMFAAIPTQEEMYEGKISNAADLLKQLERIGIKRESIAGLVGFGEWTSAIKAQEGISKDAISANTDAKENQIAFAGNALFGVVEAIARADKQLPSEIAGKLDIVVKDTAIVVEAKEINAKIEDLITSYRKTIEAI